jgi:methyl-accepting chemotaxis protein
MDEVTQQNAALVEQAAAASESPEEQAQELAEAVGIFKLDLEDVRYRPDQLPGNIKRLTARPAKPNRSDNRQTRKGKLAAVGGDWSEF